MYLSSLSWSWWESHYDHHQYHNNHNDNNHHYYYHHQQHHPHHHICFFFFFCFFVFFIIIIAITETTYAYIFAYLHAHIHTYPHHHHDDPCVRASDESPNSARNLLAVRGLISSSIVSAMFSKSPTFTPCAYIYIHTYAHTPHVELSPYMMTQIHACLSRSHEYYIFLNWYITFKPVGTWFLKLISRWRCAQNDALVIALRMSSHHLWPCCWAGGGPQVRDVFVGFAVAVVWRVSHCVCISKIRCSSYVSHGLRATFESWDSF